MMVRRGFYLVLRWAPVVLPLWLVIAMGFQDWDSVDILLLPVAGIALAAGLAVVYLFTWLRKDVRGAAAVSWIDVAVLGLWFVAILAAPFAEGTPILLIVLVLGIIAFWSALIQWFLETRRRVRSVLDEFGVAVVSAEEYRATRIAKPGEASPDSPLRGQVIRIEPPTEPRGD